jgi:signal transduction histidine kinase
MLRVKAATAPNGLDADQDAALLLRNLGRAVLGVGLLLVVILLLTGGTIRPSLWATNAVGITMLLLVRAGRLRAAAYALCWGLLFSGAVGVYTFGLRSTGALVLPLAIMSGGWLLGRFAAVFLAAVGSMVSLWVFIEQMQGKVRATTPVIEVDVMAYIAIFSVTAMLGAAMAATLRRQYTKVNALANSLQEANATLEQRVAERSVQLAGMQQKVMDSEKLTSLGSMVAGISHELNTPLGNALTVSSTLEEQVKTLSQRVESGKLTRTDMAEFLTGAAGMAQLTTQSITRAAALVSSFKQVAADQTSEQRREFQLDRVVADNVAALRPSMSKTDRFSNLTIELHIPAEIACDSYPGPLGQVITNLVQNAVMHAFDPHTPGRITVSAQMRGERVYLEVSDNGHGMPPVVQARVFEPFFTTRLGQGGSGLGLSVSHRIATSVLGGELFVRSEPGVGSTFTLAFPARLPGGL